MIHKNIAFQTHIKNNFKALAIFFFALAVLSFFASFVVASIMTSYRYSAIEWIFRYIEAYMWFYIGAALCIVVGLLLYAQKDGTLTVTDLYVCLESPNDLLILPLWNITCIRKTGNSLIITTANSRVQVGNVASCNEIINAVLAQSRKQLDGE